MAFREALQIFSAIRYRTIRNEFGGRLGYATLLSFTMAAFDKNRKKLARCCNAGVNAAPRHSPYLSADKP